MSLNQTCFCGSKQNFSSCCQPFIEGKVEQLAFPKTPEQLMRSRFSAYAINDGQYIYDTYAKSSQALQSIKEINDWSKACLWVALKIHSINNDDLNKNESHEQFVEFSVFYITDNILWELRENSRFVLENAVLDSNKVTNLQWRYLDGEIIKHCELMNIKRKEVCPCNNYSTAWTIKKGKKYKQCCGK